MDRVARERLDLDQLAGRGGLRDADGLGGAADLACLCRSGKEAEVGKLEVVEADRHRRNLLQECSRCFRKRRLTGPGPRANPRRRFCRKLQS
jgi:hypothetical protein